MRQRLFRKVRESIEARLFLAKPPFCAALRQLAALVADMSRVRCLAASPGHLYVLEEYADQQVALRDQTTKPGLEGLVEKMQQVKERRSTCHQSAHPEGGIRKWKACIFCEHVARCMKPKEACIALTFHPIMLTSDAMKGRQRNSISSSHALPAVPFHQIHFMVPELAAISFPKPCIFICTSG